MGTEPERNTRELARRTRRCMSGVGSILRTDWDPIGITEEQVLAEEYAAYAPRILKMLEQGWSADAIVRELEGIEKQEMGIADASPTRRESAARRLVDLWRDRAD